MSDLVAVVPPQDQYDAGSVEPVTSVISSELNATDDKGS
jgi:hypothetical protein